MLETIIIGIIAGCFVGLGVGWFVLELQFKHTVIIRELVSGRKIIKRDKAKEVIKDGVNYWQLKKERNKEAKLMPVPPAAAVEVTTKGKKWTEVYRTETGEYIFLKDEANVVEMPQDLLKMPKDIEKIKDIEQRTAAYDVWKEKATAEWRKNNRTISAYEPLTSKQRLILISNIKKAQARKTFSWQQNLPMVVGMGALVIIVVALMIFYSDIAAPVISMHDRELSYEAMRTEQLKILRDISQGIQTIEDNQKSMGTEPPN